LVPRSVMQVIKRHFKCKRHAVYGIRRPCVFLSRLYVAVHYAQSIKKYELSFHLRLCHVFIQVSEQIQKAGMIVTVISQSSSAWQAIIRVAYFILYGPRSHFPYRIEMSHAVRKSSCIGDVENSLLSGIKIMHRLVCHHYAMSFLHLNYELQGKAKLSECLIKHHIVKTFRGSGGKAPRIFNLDTR